MLCSELHCQKGYTLILFESKVFFFLFSNLDTLRRATTGRFPPWRQPTSKSMVSLVNSHTNASSRRKHLWRVFFFFINFDAGLRGTLSLELIDAKVLSLECDNCL
jgi:hypothetical protein